MMVIFISECKKKAIRRTQLVLDSFANRIGSSTWQTVITQEGLVEVKRLLSKTASKNTSVSCLWQRSRIYSQLLWIVGNKDIFNSYGMVAVNSTSKEFFMDLEDGENMVDNKKDAQEAVQEKKFYANTNKQDLAEHLFAVGFVAKKLFEKAIGSNKVKSELAKAVFLAGCLHDIGKVQKEFQDYLKKDKLAIYDEDTQHIDIDYYDGKTKNYFDNNLKHNELSLLLIVYFEEYFEKYKNINPINQNHIKHIVYYHHAKPFRKKDKDIDKIQDFYNLYLLNNNEDEFIQIIKYTLKVLKNVDQLAADYEQNEQNQLIKSNIPLELDSINIKDFKAKIKDKSLPEFKDYAGGGGSPRLTRKHSTKCI